VTDVIADETERARPAPGSDLLAVLRLPVRLWLLVVFMGLGFASGFVVGGLQDGRERPAVPAVANQGIPFSPGSFGPPLSEEQLTGGLPPNHPTVDPAAGAPADAPAGPDGSPTPTPAPADGATP
jgi:hypothetical protein